MARGIRSLIAGTPKGGILASSPSPEMSVQVRPAIISFNEMETNLTKAETRVAAGYVDGLIGKEIADRYGISYSTVVNHTQHIYDKAGIRHSTNALVAWFLSKTFNLDLAELRRKHHG